MCEEYLRAHMNGRNLMKGGVLPGISMSIGGFARAPMRRGSTFWLSEHSTSRSLQVLRDAKIPQLECPVAFMLLCGEILFNLHDFAPSKACKGHGLERSKGIQENLAFYATRREILIFLFDTSEPTTGAQCEYCTC